MAARSTKVETSVTKFVPMSSVNTKAIPELIGVTPFGTGFLEQSSNLGMNAFPIMNITPCIPKFMEGLALFRLEPQWPKYKELLATLGYTLNENKLSLVYTMDSLPSETFSNEYGQTFLSKMADVVSETASDLSQMTGQADLVKTANEISGALAAQPGAAGLIGSTMQEFGTAAGNIYKPVAAASPFVKSIGETTNKLLGGQRIDFPAVWKNSTFTPSYSVTIRLYNPSPGSAAITERSIIAPLAAILTLACPAMTSQEGDLYKYPFFCKIRSNGLFSIEAGAITSISVQKGGGEGLVAWNRRVGLVDVRIDFQNLYSTMLVGSSATSDRPVVKEYLETLKAGKEILGIPSGTIGNKGAKSESNYQYVPSKPTNKAEPTKKSRSTSSNSAVAKDLANKSENPGSHIPRSR